MGSGKKNQKKEGGGGVGEGLWLDPAPWGTLLRQIEHGRGNWEVRPWLREQRAGAKNPLVHVRYQPRSRRVRSKERKPT
jgi:hypothetical protein